MVDKDEEEAKYLPIIKTKLQETAKELGIFNDDFKNAINKLELDISTPLSLPPNFDLRVATVDDADAVADVQVSSLKEILSENERVQALEKNKQAEFWSKTIPNINKGANTSFRVMVDSAANKVAGFCIVAYPETGQVEGELRSIHIHPNYQGNKLGKSTLAVIWNEMKEKGCASLHASTTEGTPSEQRFYHACGFYPDGHKVPRQTWGGIDYGRELMQIRFRKPTNLPLSVVNTVTRFVHEKWTQDKVKTDGAKTDYPVELISKILSKIEQELLIQEKKSKKEWVKAKAEKAVQEARELTNKTKDKLSKTFKR